MKIKTRLRYNTLFSTIIVLLIGLMLIYSSLQHNKIIQENRSVNQVVIAVFELNILANEYLFDQSNRSQRQWHMKYNSLSKLIGDIESKIEEEALLIEEMWGFQKILKSIFSQLTTEYKGLEDSEETFSQTSALRNILTDNLMTKSQAMISVTEQLSHRISQRVVSTHKNTSFLLISLIFTAMLLISINSMFMGRSILQPILNIQKGSRQIGKGNLDYKINKITQDEFGELSESINKMAESLKTITVSRNELQREIAGRKQAEGELDRIFELSPDLICTANAKDGYFKRVNPAWEMFGRPIEEFTSRPFNDFVHPEDREKTAQVLENQISGKSVFEFENRYRCKDGSYRTLEWHATAAQADGTIYAVARDVTERKQVEEEIKASLKEKEMLLGEIHHRVKNNMQIITSLLRLQADKTEDKKYADMFKEGENRIRSMALIHEQLYQSRDFADIDFGEYIKRLANGLFTSHGVDTKKIKLNIEIRDISLDLENAIPCGLIINELVSNSLKHAFPQGKEGKINISLRSINEDELELTVSDDGAGIPKDPDIRDTDTMGMLLVKVLAEHQLDGKIELNREKGTQFHIKFKRTIYKPRI